MRYSSVLLTSADYDDVTHTSSPRLRLWFGAQTAYTDSDWLKQLKRFTAGRFVLTETKQFQNSFENVLFQFRLNCVKFNKKFFRGWGEGWECVANVLSHCLWQPAYILHIRQLS